MVTRGVNGRSARLDAVEWQGFWFCDTKHARYGLFVIVYARINIIAHDARHQCLRTSICIQVRTTAEGRDQLLSGERSVVSFFGHNPDDPPSPSQVARQTQFRVSRNSIRSSSLHVSHLRREIIRRRLSRHIARPFGCIIYPKKLVYRHVSHAVFDYGLAWACAKLNINLVITTG